VIKESRYGIVTARALFLNDLKKPVYDKGILWFFLLVAVTIVTTYYTSRVIASIWYIIVLVLYYRSDDEPMWLAFFLITVDGFMGFFGLYSVTLSILPGLPAIELSQFYIILTAVKAYSRRIKYPVFYRKYLQVLGLYVLLLIVWGQFMGLSHELNLYMRVIKTILPFLLFFSLPRLMPDLHSYKRFFGILFVVVLLAFAVQIFTLLTGINYTENFIDAKEQVNEGEPFRNFYNATSTLIGLFGAFLFLSMKGKTGFSTWFLLLVVFSSVMMAVISATRGWIVAFSLIIVLSGIFVRTIDIKKLVGLILLSGVLTLIGANSDQIRKQVMFSKERLMSIESISSGDLTAKGTLHRLDVRSPKVINIWRQNPIFGWGFSDMGFKNSDGHVGNQNILMFSGLVGFILILGFMIFFSYKIFLAYRRSGKTMPFRSGYLIFIIFLAGWFVIHATSGQQFAFNALPIRAIPQAVILGLGGIYYKFSLVSR
jgi:hypothetical protein